MFAMIVHHCQCISSHIQIWKHCPNIKVYATQRTKLIIKPAALITTTRRSVLLWLICSCCNVTKENYLSKVLHLEITSNVILAWNNSRYKYKKILRPSKEGAFAVVFCTTGNLIKTDLKMWQNMFLLTRLFFSL